MIGLSVSFCIKDICQGKVKFEDVEKIIGSTRIQNEYDFNVVVDRYSQVYWHGFAAKAESILYTLWTSGKLEQPRISFNRCPSISQGHWVKNESEIQWVDL